MSPTVRNGGRHCLDGLVAPDRTPWPGLAELKAVVVRVGAARRRRHLDLQLVSDKHDVRDLDHLRFGWVVQDDGAAIVGGDLDVPRVAARSSVTLPIAAEIRDLVPTHREASVGRRSAQSCPRRPPGPTRVTWSPPVRADSTVPSGLPVRELPVLGRSPASSSTSRTDRLTVGAAVLDPAFGRLVRLGDLELDGPVLDVARAPTENDRGQGPRQQRPRPTWWWWGQRVQHRTDSVRRDEGGRVVVTG